MNTDEQALGGRLPLLYETELDDSQRRVYERLLSVQVAEAAAAGFPARTADGRFIGPFNAFLHFAGPGAALLDWGAAQAHPSALSPLARQVVTLAVGAVWGAAFEIQAHIAGGLAAGLSRPAIDAVLDGRDHPDLPADGRIARMLAADLLVDHRVGQEHYDAAVDELGTEGVAAVAHLVGQYVTISALLIAFDVPAANPAGTAPAPAPTPAPQTHLD